MDKKLLIFLISFPIISILITWSVLNTKEVTHNDIDFPQQDKQQKVADTFVNDAYIINYGETGKPKSQIIGEKLFHYPGNEDSEISKPIITFFREQGSPVLISADQGWSNHDGSRIILKGNTVISRERSEHNQYSQLKTPQLTIWPDKEYAETDEKIKITTDTTVVTAVGMQAYLDVEHYILLHNVKGRHLSKSMKK